MKKKSFVDLYYRKYKNVDILDHVIGVISDDLNTITRSINTIYIYLSNKVFA